LTGASLAAGGEDAGSGGSEGEGVAAEEGEFDYATLFDDFAEAGGLGFELDRRCTDFEGLGDGADFERDGDGGGEAYGEAKVQNAGGTEASFFGIDVVCTGG